MNENLPNYRVLLIGMSEYDDKSLNIPNVKENIKQLKEIFLDEYIFGFTNDDLCEIKLENEQVKWGDNKRLFIVENLSANHVRTCLMKFSNFSEKEGALLLYFAGHGGEIQTDVPDQKYSFWCKDADTKTGNGVVTSDSLSGTFNNTKNKAQKNILIVDTCHAAAINIKYLKRANLYQCFSTNARDKAYYDEKKEEVPTYFTKVIIEVLKNGESTNEAFLNWSVFKTLVEGTFETIQNELAEELRRQEPQFVDAGKKPNFAFCKNKYHSIEYDIAKNARNYVLLVGPYFFQKEKDYENELVKKGICLVSEEQGIITTLPSRESDVWEEAHNGGNILFNGIADKIKEMKEIGFAKIVLMVPELEGEKDVIFLSKYRELDIIGEAKSISFKTKILKKLGDKRIICLGVPLHRWYVKLLLADALPPKNSEELLIVGWNGWGGTEDCKQNHRHFYKNDNVFFYDDEPQKWFDKVKKEKQKYNLDILNKGKEAVEEALKNYLFEDKKENAYATISGFVRNYDKGKVRQVASVHGAKKEDAAAELKKLVNEVYDEKEKEFSVSKGNVY